MNEPTEDECLLSDLAHEFTQRLRQGECPSIEEYVQRYPHLAPDIDEVFSTLLLIESPHNATESDIPARGSEPGWKHGGKTFGEYRILREVAQGGMGVVYEAIHETLGRRVALKVLPARNVADAQHLARFKREARASAHLHHTNIVPIYDVGDVDGVHFYTMQFIDGQPLNALPDDMAGASSPFHLSVARWQAAQLAKIAAWEELPDRIVETDVVADRSDLPDTNLADANVASDPDHLPEADAARRGPAATRSPAPSRSGIAYYRHVARLGKQVADALACAHGEGVLHRDIKPGNLLLDAQGKVWITDFGLALIAGQDELTSPGDVVGTLRYLAPERFDGHADERGDIYSLGVTLYEMLAGRPAFAASTRARLIDQILNTGPMAPRRIDPLIPRDLETIILKAMSRDPSQRYPRADGLAEDLDRFITGRPILARRLSAWGHTWSWCRRNKALAAAIGLAAVLLAAVLVVSLVDSVRIRNQLHQTQVAKREARERLFDSLVSQAHARWMGGERAGRRFETLTLLRGATSLARDLQLPRDAFARFRNEAMAALCLPDEQIAQTVDAFPIGTAAVAFDSEIQRYARGDTEGNVTIHRVSDHDVLQRLPNSGPGFALDVVDGLAFSPDGTYLKQRCRDDQRKENKLRLWDISGIAPRLTVEISEKTGESTEFAPDGRHLGVVIYHPPPASAEVTNPTIQAHVLDLASGRDVAPPLAADQTTRLVFHPTQGQLAVSDASAVRIIQADTGAELSRWNRPQTVTLAWSPDGRQLLARSHEDPTIHRWDVDRQRELPPLDSHLTDRIDRIVFSHRGDRFLCASRFRFQIWDFPSGQIVWDSPQSALPGIRFSQDDQVLAGFMGVYPKVRILRVACGLELRRLPLASPIATPVDSDFPRAVMTHDGRLLAVTSQAGTTLLNLQNYEELAVIPGARLPLVFDSDGALLTHADAPESAVRWPIIVSTEGRLSVSIGTPQSLTEIQDDPEPKPSLLAGLGTWAASQDGRVIATPWQREGTTAGANIFIADNKDRRKFRCLELGPQHDVRYKSVSPDGQWVATGSVSWLSKRSASTDTVTIWDAETGQRIKDLLVGEGFPQFSPDGKWIAVTSGVFPESVRVWRVGSWQPAPVPSPVPGPGLSTVAFDAESQLMAAQGYRIRLLVPETGRELAWLSVPEETSIAPQGFTPDGTRLIAWGVGNGQLYIWDLRSIRQQLAELGLDWGAPP